ncbi:hypothetical protein [Salinimicrobium soli]|uniref:hypothetical protein n=1 Tax=Salinimicrobium soli TaxID=1254399 RepID=UPI003AAB1059
MDLKKILLFTGIVFISFASNAQRIWEGSYNRLGVQGGVNYFNILTDDLEIQARPSWTAGFTTRASFYNEFQFIYGINFYDFKVDMDGRTKLEETSPKSTIEYNMIGVQANFFGSYKMLGNSLSVEAGPVIQVNGKLNARQDKEYYYLAGYDIQAIDIEKVSPFNVNLAAGISGGLETLKFWLQYQYGINNILNGVNDEGLKEKDASVPDFKGHISMLAGGITIFL